MDDEYIVDAILDKRLATKEDTNAEEGEVLYLVAWEGYDPSHNTWEPYENIIDDNLINDYEKRADTAEDDLDNDEIDQAEEEACATAADMGTAPASVDMEVDQQQLSQEILRMHAPTLEVSSV